MVISPRVSRSSPSSSGTVACNSVELMIVLYTITVTRIIYDFVELLAADIISTVEFDHTGDYLATGDKGGRVVLFERNESVSSESN